MSKGLDPSAFFLMAPFQLEAPKAFNEHIVNMRGHSTIKSHLFSLLY
jgi:hypothetical protein